MKILNNPLMKLPAAAKAVAFLAAHPALGAVFRELLGELRKECHRLANHSWARRKGPMAAYWMAAGAYVGHCMRLIRPGCAASPLAPSQVALDAERFRVLETYWNSSYKGKPLYRYIAEDGLGAGGLRAILDDAISLIKLHRSN